MPTTLFAERFAVPAEPDLHSPQPRSRYDESLHYAVTPEGTPSVEIGVVGSTNTMTAVGAEPADSDHAWDRIRASTDTITKAESDRDY